MPPPPPSTSALYPISKMFFLPQIRVLVYVLKPIYCQLVILIGTFQLWFKFCLWRGCKQTEMSTEKGKKISGRDNNWFDDITDDTNV